MICGNDVIALNPRRGADLLASTTFLVPLRGCLVSVFFLKPYVWVRSRVEFGVGFRVRVRVGVGVVGSGLLL
jgi:hypothetical protein